MAARPTQPASAGLERFVSRVQQANRAKSREVVLTIEEANELHGALTLLLTQRATMLEDIVALQKRAESPEVTSVEVSGGSF